MLSLQVAIEHKDPAINAMYTLVEAAQDSDDDEKMTSSIATDTQQKVEALTAPIDIQQLVRSIRSHDPRVTHFPIHWDTQTSLTQDMATCSIDNITNTDDVSMPLVASTTAETSAMMNDDISDSSDDDVDKDTEDIVMVMKVCADNIVTKSQQQHKQQYAQQMANSIQKQLYDPISRCTYVSLAILLTICSQLQKREYHLKWQEQQSCCVWHASSDNITAWEVAVRRDSI
jgi:hypothetical protein